MCQFWIVIVYELLFSGVFLKRKLYDSMSGTNSIFRNHGKYTYFDKTGTKVIRVLLVS